ncbi:CGNR zinc finger domain-containing protein [Nonomuraea sp. NPDC050394]|uniref:CGNR zinc finger domain-containing protein n=1 Tax=Nonomuraea sp. NPDC050394 TaxID=3364363 RepID=UPI0037B042F1
MPLGHDVAHSLATVVELVNTAPGTAGQEDLPGLAELRAFVDSREFSAVSTLTPDDLDQVRMVRDAFHRVFTALDQASAVRILNALLAQTRITPRLTDHDGHPLHIHYHAAGSVLAGRLAADCGVAVARLLVEGEWGRLRTCSVSDCDKVFVDESRNRSRVYCDSRTCGNRMHVAAYRARRRT